MRLILKYFIALLVAAVFTGITILFVAAVNVMFVGTIPFYGAIIATITTFILYSFVTLLIAYLSQK